MGMFDDLIPQTPQATTEGGMFDDLIPQRRSLLQRGAAAVGLPEEVADVVRGPGYGLPGLRAFDDAATFLVDEVTQGAPRSREMLQPENMKGTLRGAGAAAGGLVGASAGPAGLIGGTAVGAYGGGLLGQLYEDAARSLGYETREPPSIQDRITEPIWDAAVDTGITAGVAGIPVAAHGARQLAKRALRITPKSEEAAREAAELGVDLGVANVAEGGPGAGAVNVLGRIPLIGGSARNAANDLAQRFIRAREKLFESVGALRPTEDMSSTAFRAATRKFDSFAEKAGKKYERAHKLGLKDGRYIDTNKVVVAANDAARQIRRMPQTIEPKSGLPVQMEPVGASEILDFLDDVGRLAPKMSVPEVRQLDHSIENLLKRTLTRQGISFGQVNAVREAIKETVKDAAGKRASARALVEADTFFERGRRIFETPTGQRYGRITRNVFNVGIERPGVRNPDELIGAVTNIRSADAVRDFRRISGTEAVRDLARYRLESAFREASGEVPQSLGLGRRWTFNSDRFRKSLGLVDAGSNEYSAMREMLKGSGISINDLNKFARVAESMGRAAIADASTFAARATALRGAGGVITALKGALTAGLGTAGGAVSGSAISPASAALVLVSRYGLGHMMRPGLLRNLIKAFDPNTKESAKRAAVLHLMRQLQRDQDFMMVEGEEMADPVVPPRERRSLESILGARTLMGGGEI